MQPSPELVKGVTGLNVYDYDTDVKCREGVGCVKILKELGGGTLSIIGSLWLIYAQSSRRVCLPVPSETFGLAINSYLPEGLGECKPFHAPEQHGQVSAGECGGCWWKIKGCASGA